jgi:hypothetical protein
MSTPAQGIPNSQMSPSTSTSDLAEACLLLPTLWGTSQLDMSEARFCTK